MITVQISGKQVELEGPTGLLDYVRSLGIDPRAIAVEVNGEILDRDRYGTCILRHEDVIEIVRMVGGGQGVEAPAPGLLPAAARGRFRDRRRQLCRF